MNPIVAPGIGRRLQLLIFVTLLLSACATTVQEPQPPEPPEVILRVLSIGNSFSVDAMSYLPYVVRSVAPHVHITVGLLNHGGATLDKHCGFVQSGGKYQYYYKAEDDGHWTRPRGQSYGATIGEVIREEPWDVIVLQQGSAQCRDWSTYQPSLDNLVAWIRAQVGDTPVVAWMLIPAFADGFTRLNGSTSDEMYRDIASCAQRVMDSGRAQLLLPVGTAIQNARHTSLGRYGQFGGLTFDGMHMNDGIGCLIEAYVIAQALFRYWNIPADINDDHTHVTQEWLGTRWVQQQNGPPAVVTEDDCSLAKQCVTRAMNRPYDISDD